MTSSRQITLRQAALTAAFTGLIVGLGVPFAESAVYPKLVISGNIKGTVQNILEHKTLFSVGFLAYFFAFAGDIIVAWALYVLLAPANRSLSLLTAWLRLVFSIIAVIASLKLATAFRILNSADYLAAVGTEPVHAHIQLLIYSFRNEFSQGLIVFGIHLILLGYLVYLSGYIPRAMGILLVIAGFGYIAFYLGPYLYPNVRLKFFMLVISGIGELIFMLWLLIKGWKIKEQTAM